VLKTTGVQVLSGSVPLSIPVDQADGDEFFGYLIRYLDNANVLRLVYDVFGAEYAAKFLSLFHGYTIIVPPRNFWLRAFRNVYIYTILSKESKKTDVVRWRKMVLRLAKVYRLPPKTVVEIHKSVKKKVGKR
jgi:hypothetical protein